MLATRDAVSHLRGVVDSSDGTTVVVTGLKGTTPVTTIVVDGAAAPFVSDATLFAYSPLSVQSGMSGSSLSSVDSLTVAGTTAAPIEKIEFRYRDGARISATLVDGAFAENLDPARGGVTVIAYAGDGTVVASRYVAAPSAPGTVASAG